MPSVTASFWVVPVGVVTFGVVTCRLVTRGFVVCGVVPWAVEVLPCWAAAIMGNCDKNAAMIRYLETVLFMWSS